LAQALFDTPMAVDENSNACYTQRLMPLHISGARRPGAANRMLHSAWAGGAGVSPTPSCPDFYMENAP